MCSQIKPVKISLDDFVLSGGGANGESYFSKTDPSIMLKLYFPGLIDQPLEEMSLSRKVYELGITTPRPGDYVVTEDGRYGIIYHRIVDKVSYARATADHPENVARYAEEFAGMCLKLHSTHIDTRTFISTKKRYMQLLDWNPFFTRVEKDRIAEFIHDVPDEDVANHGDLQFGNAIFVGEKRYFIDLGEFSWGNHLFDVAMVYLCCNISPEPFVLETFHMSRALAEKFWRCFVPCYFGADRSLEDIEAEIRPFAGLKTLLIEKNTNTPQPVFRSLLKEIIG